MIVSDKSGSGFQNVTPGTYQGVCTQIIDLGSQDSTYKGVTKKVRKLYLGWELSELMEDGRPFLVRSMYTASLGEKSALRKTLESWRGRSFTDEELKGFDLSKLLGVNGLLSMVQNDKYVNVGSISPLLKGMVPIQAQSGFTIFNLDEFSESQYSALSDYLKGKICQSPEYAKVSGKPVEHHADADGVPVDDIPF